MENDPAFERIAAIKSVLINERTVLSKVKAFFEDHGIAYINPLPQLQEQVARLQLYPGNFDVNQIKMDTGSLPKASSDISDS